MTTWSLSSLGKLSASELKKLQRKQKKAQLKAQAKAQEEKKGVCTINTMNSCVIPCDKHVISCDNIPRREQAP